MRSYVVPEGMGGEMTAQRSFQGLGFFTILLAAGLYSLVKGSFSLLTPDQQAYRLFVREEYQEAANHFAAAGRAPQADHARALLRRAGC